MTQGQTNQYNAAHTLFIQEIAKVSCSTNSIRKARSEHQGSSLHYWLLGANLQPCVAQVASNCESGNDVGKFQSTLHQAGSLGSTKVAPSSPSSNKNSLFGPSAILAYHNSTKLEDRIMERDFMHKRSPKHNSKANSYVTNATL